MAIEAAVVDPHVVTGSRQQVVLYPVLEVHLTYHADGTVKEWTIPSCAFHDLHSTTEQELAGMGLAILGNLIQIVGKDLYDEALGATLLLKHHAKDAGIECPWPGMPNDKPLPLDLMEMPFDIAMFLNDDGNGQRRVDRLALMRRIETTWVPWLKAHMNTVLHA